ncbi:MAG: DUF4160 domain-containing protein [Planctomycetes bacterium]|nr:DUF4160 domain-containing protein [Planctomycetota bacterium]
MPEISRFLGIVVRMYFEDHQPPHFHARYGEYRIKILIESGVIELRWSEPCWYTWWRRDIAVGTGSGSGSTMDWRARSISRPR